MQLDRITLERHQFWAYLAAILAGLGVGLLIPGAEEPFAALIWPVLAILLYVTFLQVPLLHLRQAFRERRLFVAVLLGNFVLLPALAWALVQFLPDNPALRLGVLLVLLVPCTDWFITFSQLGGGSTAGAVVVTPLNLVLQLLLLPLYLWLMLGAELRAAVSLADVWPAIVMVLGALVLALLSERRMTGRPRLQRWCDRAAWAPVPLLSVVLFLVAAVQVATVQQSLGWLPWLIVLYATFQLLAALLARLIASGLRLPLAQGRTLAFSMGTRNSFVVLPFALSLPAGWELAAVAIVVQSLVELLGMVFYLWWIPRRLFSP